MGWWTDKEGVSFLDLYSKYILNIFRIKYKWPKGTENR